MIKLTWTEPGWKLAWFLQWRLVSSEKEILYNFNLCPLLIACKLYFYGSWCSLKKFVGRHANDVEIYNPYPESFLGRVLHTAVISKLLPRSDNPIIFAIQNDRYVVLHFLFYRSLWHFEAIRCHVLQFSWLWMIPSLVTPLVVYNRYYCFLVPLTLPVIVVAVYFYWLSMKMFKHAWSLPTHVFAL